MRGTASESLSVHTITQIDCTEYSEPTLKLRHNFKYKTKDTFGCVITICNTNGIPFSVIPFDFFIDLIVL